MIMNLKLSMMKKGNKRKKPQNKNKLIPTNKKRKRRRGIEIICLRVSQEKWKISTKNKKNNSWNLTRQSIKGNFMKVSKAEKDFRLQRMVNILGSGLMDRNMEMAKWNTILEHSMKENGKADFSMAKESILMKQKMFTKGAFKMDFTMGWESWNTSMEMSMMENGKTEKNMVGELILGEMRIIMTELGIVTSQREKVPRWLTITSIAGNIRRERKKD